MVQRRLIGILGGMGPRAHVLFEQRLLERAASLLGAKKDADFPAWILASFPGTPDRTRGLCGGGESPLPFMLRALERLAAAGADFAVSACVTSHAFFGGGVRSPLPILSLPAIVARSMAAAGVKRAGILATSGTLRTGLFEKAFAAAGCGCLSLLDLPGGAAAQANLVMAAIYGSGDLSSGAAGGIKGDGPTRKTSGLLLAAGVRLAEAGADALVLGCTEISLVADRLAKAGPRLVDPLAIAAEAAICRAYELPFAGLGGAESWEGCFL